MAKSYYMVRLMKRELRPFLYEARTPLPSAMAARSGNFLERISIIKARNKLEAAMIAEMENPRHFVVRDSIARLN